MVKHYSIKVFGQVQGVYFRVHAKQAADILGVSGWVQNQPDGSVKIEAEGEENALKSFLKWCEEASKEAKVDKVESQATPVLNLQGFLIISAQ